MQPTWDLAVIGGGPAGALVALTVARARPEWRCVLFEREPEPVMRPCGEFLSPDGLRILGDAGLEAAIEATGARRLTGLSLVAPDGRIASDYQPVLGKAPPRRWGWGIRRERLHRVMRDAVAGACSLATGCQLRDVRQDVSGWSLTWRCDGQTHTGHARMLVGADGRQSIVRRRAGLDARPARQRFALMARARGFPARHHGEMHLGPIGQVGVAPLDGGEVNLNVLLAPASRSVLRGRSPRDVLRVALAHTPTLRERTRDVTFDRVLTTGSLPQGAHAVVRDGLALVGDAAGFCDPFTGEGMCIALQGAESLAACLRDVPATGAITARHLAPYADAYARRFGSRKRVGGLLQYLLDRRGLAEQLVARIGKLPGASALAVAISGDYVLAEPPRG